MNIYKASDNFVQREMGSETVLIPVGEQDFKNNSIIVLNETALLMWNELKNEMNVTQLVKVLVSEFDVNAIDVLDDVDNFLKTLLNVGAINVKKTDPYIESDTVA